MYQLDKAHLIDCLKSNFLQASELEVLQAVLKWGEHELIRRMEDRGIILLNLKQTNLKYINNNLLINIVNNNNNKCIKL